MPIHARLRIRSQLLKIKAWDEITGLFFDGRKDKTLAVIKKGSKFYKTSIIEEHISMVVEFGSHFLTHVTPRSGTAANIATAMMDYFEEKAIPLDRLKAIGCDGTNVNTGNSGGVIRKIESKLNRPLQWLICLLHCNELLLRHLLIKLILVLLVQLF